MSRFPHLLTRTAARAPRRVLVVIVVITGVLASFIPQAELSNDSTAFSPSSDEVDALNEVRDRFEDSTTAALQMVVIGDDVISADGVATSTAITEIAQDSFGDALAANGGQSGVVSFLDAASQAAERDGVDLAEADDATVDALQADGFGQFEPARADLVRSLSAGDDPTTADAGIVLIQLRRNAFADEEALVDAKRDFVDEIDAADLPLDANAFSLELVRAPDDSFQREVGQLFLFAAIIILVVLALVLRARRGPNLSAAGAVRRSMADMGLAIGGVLIAVVWTQGLGVVLGPDYAGIVGAPTPPTQIVPILLLALGVSYAIHTHSRYREEIARGNTDPTSVAGGLGRTVGVALTLSMLTTGIGFLTNIVSPLPAIQDLGVLAATGILAVLVVDLTFLVAARTLLDRRAVATGALAVEEIAPSESSVFARVAVLGLRPVLAAPLAVLGVTAALTAASVVAATSLSTEFSQTDFLPDGDPSKEAILVLDASFSGGVGETSEILVTGDVLTPDVHNATVTVEDRLAGQPGIVMLDGRPDLSSPVTELTAAQELDANADQAAAVATAIDAGLAPDGTITAGGDVATIYAEMAAAFPNVQSVVDPGGEQGPATRIAVVSQSESVGVDTIEDAFDQALVPLDDLGVEATATSDAIVNEQTITALSDSAISGLLIALGVVTLLLAGVYWFRSRQAGLGALVVAPVGAIVLNTFGLMWIFGIPFDPITAIVAALVVGVAIDFCIHLGERFVEDLSSADDVEAALARALRHTGAALAGSAATTILGFSALTLGSIVPFARLGTVMIFAMLLSLLAIMFVLPAALVIYGRRQSTKTTDDDAIEGVDEPEGNLAPT